MRPPICMASPLQTNPAGDYCIRANATREGRMEDRRTKQMLAGLAWAGVALAGIAVAQTPLPSHGPAKGYLVITGGQPDYDRMIALAGGKSEERRVGKECRSRWSP